MFSLNTVSRIAGIFHTYISRISSPLLKPQRHSCSLTVLTPRSAHTIEQTTTPDHSVYCIEGVNAYMLHRKLVNAKHHETPQAFLGKLKIEPHDLGVIQNATYNTVGLRKNLQKQANFHSGSCEVKWT